MGKIELGQVVMSEGIKQFIEKDYSNITMIEHCLMDRHCNCDWGNLCEEDKQMNDYAVEHGRRILSAYTVVGEDNTKIWIITEADRSCTTILFPEEYFKYDF